MFITKTKDLSVVPDVFVSGEDYKLYRNISTLVFWLIPNFHLRRRLTGSDLVIKFEIYSWLYVIWRRSAFHDYFSYYLLFNYSVAHQYYYSETTIESLYKQSLKTLDKKSVQFHHCSI